MAKFVFPLNSILNIKEKLEDQKRLEFGRAVSRFEQEKQKKILLIKEKEYYISFFRSSIEKGINPNELLNCNDYIEIIKQKIVMQQKAIEKAEQYVNETRQELVEASKQKKMYAILKENKLGEFLKEEKITEQKLVDEIVSYKFNNRSV